MKSYLRAKWFVASVLALMLSFAMALAPCKQAFAAIAQGVTNTQGVAQGTQGTAGASGTGGTSGSQVVSGTPSDAPDTTGPQFDSNGLPIEKYSYDDAYKQSLFIQTDNDTDGDGTDDWVHFDVARPNTTQPVGTIIQFTPYNSELLDGEISGLNDHYGTDYQPSVSPTFTSWSRAHDWNVQPSLEDPDWNLVSNFSYNDADARIYGSPGMIPETGYLKREAVPFGFAVVTIESIGTDYSGGTPTVGDKYEAQAAEDVVYWLTKQHGSTAYVGASDPATYDEYLNPYAYTGKPDMSTVADNSWSNGKSVFTGVSYEGTIPLEVAELCGQDDPANGYGLSGVMSAGGISSWYDYYYANGAVAAPTNTDAISGASSAAYSGLQNMGPALTVQPSTGSGGGVGTSSALGVLSTDDYSESRIGTDALDLAMELSGIYGTGNDLGVLGLGTLSKPDAASREASAQQIYNNIMLNEARANGDYNSMYAARDYLPDVGDMPKGMGLFVVHGLRDWNVRISQATNLINAVDDVNASRSAANQIQLKVLFDQDGHAFNVPVNMELAWYAKYLYGTNDMGSWSSKYYVQNSDTLSVQPYDSWPLVQQQDDSTFDLTPAASGYGAGSMSIMANAVPLSAGVAADHGSSDANASATIAGATASASDGSATFTDNPVSFINAYEAAYGTSSSPIYNVDGEAITASGLSDPTLAGHRLSYVSGQLTSDVRLSGTASVSCDVTLDDTTSGDLTALLAYYPADGSAPKVITKNWLDLTNVATDGSGTIDDAHSSAWQVGETREVTLNLNPTDYVCKQGGYIGITITSTDIATTDMPLTNPTITLSHPTLSLPLTTAASNSMFGAAYPSALAGTPAGGGTSGGGTAGGSAVGGGGSSAAITPPTVPATSATAAIDDGAPTPTTGDTLSLGYLKIAVMFAVLGAVFIGIFLTTRRRKAQDGYRMAKHALPPPR
ncbi:MAG: hypothetical protein LBM21_03035 [Coriobacteriales bacterium]|jgi:predicted acyl esterase|nr:hypothetical protein [Coriobacteriales bacterium]